MIAVAGGILLAILVLLFLPLIFRLVGLALVALFVLIPAVLLWLVVGEASIILLGFFVIAGGLFAIYRPRVSAWLNSRDETRRRRKLYGASIAHSDDHLDWANRRGKYADPL